MFDSWFPKGWSTMEQLMWLYRIIKGAAPSGDNLVGSAIVGTAKAG